MPPASTQKDKRALSSSILLRESNVNMTLNAIPLQPFRLETPRATNGDDAPHFCLCWDADGINLQQVYTIVTWCYNIQWLFRHCNISSCTMLELGNSRRDLLNQSRPTNQFVDQYNQTVVLSRRRKQGMIVPECTRQQTNTRAESLALRDIYKWQYQTLTGERWSPRNLGAKRGFQQFIKLWEQLYEKVKAATEVQGAQLQCLSVGDVALLVDDLNEVLMHTRAGRQDKNAVTRFCRKVFDERVLRRLKYFVDTCEVLE
jgi:hypothetical protein